VKDEQMDRLIGGLLRAGVLLAAAVSVAGGVWYLVRNPGTAPQYGTFHREAAELRSVSGVLRAVAEGRPEGLIQLGLLLLIATPVARVALSTAAFLLARDWLYAGITLVVLAVLAVSLIGLP
jgi:uncharacterized membrane protein